MQFLNSVAVMMREAGIAAPSSEELRRIAASFGLPFFARQKPVAPLTKGTGTILLATTVEQTQRVEITFPYPVLISGMSLVVTPAVFGAFPIGLDAIQVLLDNYDRERLLTTNETNNSTVDVQAVSARSVDSALRDTMMILDAGGRPKLGITFRSRHATAGASGLTGNVLCSLDCFYTPLA